MRFNIINSNGHSIRTIEANDADHASDLVSTMFPDNYLSFTVKRSLSTVADVVDGEMFSMGILYESLYLKFAGKTYGLSNNRVMNGYYGLPSNNPVTIINPKTGIIKGGSSPAVINGVGKVYVDHCVYDQYKDSVKEQFLKAKEIIECQ